MSQVDCPRLTKAQIEKLKTDITFLSATIARLVTGHKGNKLPVATAQNGIAREFGFSSFAEWSSKSVPTIHNADFSLANNLKAESCLAVYQNMRFKDGTSLGGRLTLDIARNALSNLAANKETVIDEPSISLSDLYEVINENPEFHNHEYKEGDGYPTSFTIGASAFFFNQLSSWDHFRVYDGDDYRCYTVEEFKHIYTKEPCFNVVLGRRFDNGFSVGVR